MNVVTPSLYGGQRMRHRGNVIDLPHPGVKRNSPPDGGLFRPCGHFRGSHGEMSPELAQLVPI